MGHGGERETNSTYLNLISAFTVVCLLPEGMWLCRVRKCPVGGMKSTDIVLTLALGLPGWAHCMVRGLAAVLGDPLSIFHSAIWRGCVQELGEDTRNHFNHKINSGLQKNPLHCLLSTWWPWKSDFQAPLEGRPRRRRKAAYGSARAAACRAEQHRAPRNWRQAWGGEGQGEAPCPRPWGAMGSGAWGLGLGLQPPGVSTARPLLAAHPSVGVMRGRPRQFSKLN